MSQQQSQLKFKAAFHEAVPHLYERTITKNGRQHTFSEISVRVCDLGQEGAGWHFLNKQDDGKRVFFTLDQDDKKFEAFKDALAQTCQQESILCDPDGYVLDGYSRWFALLKLGIAPKYEIVGHLSDDAAKITFIRQRKLSRQHLSEAERMAVVQAEIIAHPERIHNWQAKLLGVSYHTVVKYRRKLEADGKLPLLAKLLRSDGVEERYYPQQPKTADEKAAAEKKAKVQAQRTLVERAKKVAPEQFIDKDTVSHSLDNIKEFLGQATIPPHCSEQVAQIAESLQAKLPTKIVSSIASTNWKSTILPMYKRKGKYGVQGDVPDNLPEQCEVAEMEPGDITVRLSDKAILILPKKAQPAKVLKTPSRAENEVKDATVEPPEEEGETLAAK